MTSEEGRDWLWIRMTLRRMRICFMRLWRYALSFGSRLTVTPRQDSHGTICSIPPSIQDGARDGTVLAPVLALEVSGALGLYMEAQWSHRWHLAWNLRKQIPLRLHPIKAIPCSVPLMRSSFVHPDFQSRWSSSCSHKVHSTPMVSPIVTGELNGTDGSIAGLPRCDLTWLLPYDRVRVSLDKQVPSPKFDKLSFRMGL
jgi:hypothetical protein